MTHKKIALPYRRIPESPYAAPDPRKLRVVPLGGLGEFGKNMMALEYGEDMILIDCGQMFPEEEMLGVDSVIPNFSFVEERIGKLRGLILTHGHEDHIGAIPYFLRDFDTPVYGSRLTLALVRGKVREMGIEDECQFHEIAARGRIQLGAFDVEFLHVSHSIPEAMALAITLPIGTVIHTGDYKFDAQDKGETSDFFGLSRYGETGVLLLMADSTNSDREGSSPSEETVLNALRPIIADAERSVILSTFASGLHRIQTVIDLAQEFGRKIFLAGRSLERNFEIATRLGLLHYPEDIILPITKADSIPPAQRLLIASGSQGEPFSAFSRLALDSFKGYEIEPGDTVIISARMIPGNEKAIYKMINHFYRRGARVITEKDAPIHATGHACREEMRQLYRMLKPKYFAPIHGELRQLISNGEIGAGLGIEPSRIFIIENGDALDLDADSITHRRFGLAGQVLVDGKIFDQLEDVVLRDRQHLSEDGMLLVILVIDKKTLKVIAGPDIVSRGFVEVDSNEELIEDCKSVVLDAFEDCAKEGKEEWEVVKAAVRKALRRFLRDETDRYPVILPVVIEI